MNPDALPPTPNNAGGLWLLDVVTGEQTPVLPDALPSDDE